MWRLRSASSLLRLQRKEYCIAKDIGKVKHLKTSQLWIREQVANKEITANTIPRGENVADTLTKHVGGEELRKHMAGTGLDILPKRHDLALGMSEEKE